jgi:succinyl-diaminopimelate desuccinylase
MDERVLAEKLVGADTSTLDGLRGAAGFVKGWLEARDIEVVEHDYNGLPVLVAAVGPETGVPTVILHGHIDVVPAHPEQFTPRTEGDRLIGRGAYDMKGGLATMMCALRDAADQDGVRVVFTCVPDEESEDVEAHSIDWLVREHGITGDFAITGEPTNLHIGIQAKGVLALRVLVTGTAAHGSTPWVGDNAILKAHDAFRRIETLPFSRESSDLFDRPSINLARISGGDAFNKVPDRCEIDVDIRYLPNQDPGAILARSARSRHRRSSAARLAARGGQTARTRTSCACATRSAA